ncbi:Rieske (2Fe-2S) protein, partial [Pseudomaricurvus alcaniphilus]|uniref:Rieske (2Fe-2S) protein n=1 Tax=Pseudomaricurvus alcaniphilus TaxID=1166482 RepID=UPI00140BB426
GAKGFDLSNRGIDTVFVVKDATGFHAYLNSCPHVNGASLPWKKDAYLDSSGAEIVCSAHGARFEPATGLCISGPCKGMSLTRIPLFVNENNEICILYDTCSKADASSEYA